MMHSGPPKLQRRGSMPGKLRRRASLSAEPVRRRGSMSGEGAKGPSQIMLSWFQASETVEEEYELGLSPVTPAPVVEEIQITGLELLRRGPGFDDDDISYDSYTRDSVQLNGARCRRVFPESARLTQSDHPLHAVAVEDKGDFDPTTMSKDCDEYDYGPQRRWTSRRSSLGSYSYANDSIEFERFKSLRRCSLGSFANDSVECKHLRKSQFANNGALGVSWHENNKYGRRRSLGRRGSLGSETMDSPMGKRLAYRGRSFEGPFMRRTSLGSVSSGVSFSVATSLSNSLSRPP